MRAGLCLSVCLVFLVVGGQALADSADLSNGVFIAHAPPNLQYTTSPPSGSWCTEYSANHVITSCEDQDNEIESQGMAVWFVLCAWTESKTWCGTEFGLGDYDEEAFVIEDHGPCFPSAGLTIPTSGWPGPEEGIALTTTDTNWAGSFQPVYWFAGYVYAEDVIPLSPDPANGFGGWARCEDQVEFESGAFGGTGLLTDGVYACPDDLPPEGNAGGEDIAEGGALEGDSPLLDAAVCCLCSCCYLLSEEDCARLGGEYHAEWTSCDPNPCATYHPEGNVLIVNAEGTGDYPTIQDALCSANEGDIIILEDGVYRGPCNHNLDFHSKALILKSRNDNPERCIIDCEGSSVGDAVVTERGFLFAGIYDASALIRGLTVFDGLTRGGT